MEIDVHFGNTTCRQCESARRDPESQVAALLQHTNLACRPGDAHAEFTRDWILRHRQFYRGRRLRRGWFQSAVQVQPPPRLTSARERRQQVNTLQDPIERLPIGFVWVMRSEEHTSELQSQS